MKRAASGAALFVDWGSESWYSDKKGGLSMYCWNCGKEMEDDLLFCPHCAMKQAGIPEPKPKRKKIPAAAVISGIVSLTALLGIILILIFAGTAPEPEPPVDPYSVALPDLASFLNTQYAYDDVSPYTHYVTCILKKSEGREAVREYMELLQKSAYQLKLDDSWDYTQDKVLCTDYIFHYTSKGEGIGWVTHKDGYRYHVKLSVYEHTKKDQITVTLYTAPGFELKDPGVDADAVK